VGKTLYTAEAHLSGGRDEGHASTKSGSVDVDIRIPPELGGDGSGTNPEELFAMGYGACFESAVRTVARRRKIEPGQTSVSGNIDVALTANGQPVD
jgi:lipoyl-dependent peroxiredoxin